MNLSKLFFELDLSRYKTAAGDPTNALKVKYVLLACYFGFLLSVVMAILTLVFRGFTRDIVGVSCWGIALFSSISLIRLGFSLDFIARFIGVCFLTFVISLILGDIHADSGKLYWAYIFPPISFFINGRRDALIGSLTLLLITIAILFGFIGDSDFPAMYKVRFIMTYSMVIMATYGVELSRHVAMKKMNMAQDDYRRKVGELVESQQALRKMQESAIESAKLATLGEMSGGIAHEINSPLMVISGNAKLIKRKLDSNDEHLTKYIDRIIDTADRVEKIVRGLRSFIRSGKEDPFEHVQLNSLVRESVSLVREKMLFSRVDLRIDEIPNDILIRCRGTEIMQVILNLVENAYDAIKENEHPWVLISYEKIDDRVGFSISDSGRGIPEEVKENVFKPFFSTKQVGKGTGLGLSISKDIIERHSGLIYLDETSKSTKFMVMFPLV